MALYIVRGLPARILKAIIGTPLLYIGWLGITTGLGNQELFETAFFLVLGGLFAFGGIAAYVSAIMNDELEIGGEDKGGTWD